MIIIFDFGIFKEYSFHKYFSIFQPSNFLEDVQDDQQVQN